MMLDKLAQLTTATAFDLDTVKPGPGEPIKMFGTGFAASTLLTITTGATSAAAGACTTATTGADGTVEFELPSSTLRYIKCTFTVGDIYVTLAGNQTNS